MTGPGHGRALVCLPTYNERDNVGPVVEAILAAAPVADVLVIDDGSPDGTGELADQLAAAEPRVHVLHRAGKQGLGKAYLAGFGWALERGYRLVLEMDADFSHDPRYLPALLAAADRRVQVLHRARKEGLGKAYLAGFAWALERGYRLVLEMDADFSHEPGHLPALLAAAEEADLVLGSRYVPGGGTQNWGLGRRLLSRGGSLYARFILGIPVRDLTGGFKCFRREVLEAIDLATVECSGYAFQIELTWRALRKGFRVVEVPIVFVDRRVGQSKMSRRIVLEAVRKVWSIRFSGFR